MILGITPHEKHQNKLKLRKIGLTVRVLFVISLLLPLIVYFLFQSGLLRSRSLYGEDIFKPVALVNTSVGLGTAFLVGETNLLTARHVVELLEIGDTVLIEFTKSPELDPMLA